MTSPLVRTVGDITFEDAIKSPSPELCGIARALRALLAEVMPGITEVPWPAQKTIGYGVGPKKMSEHFCYIGLHSSHVNLGFFYGADLDDPQGLLKGTGKALRHIKFTSAGELERAGVRNLVAQASKHLPKLTIERSS